MTNTPIIKTTATPHNPGTYHGKVAVPVYPVYVPEATPEAVTEAAENVPEMPVNVPEVATPVNTPEAAEKPVKAENTTPEATPKKSLDEIIREKAEAMAKEMLAEMKKPRRASNRSVANGETGKPSIRETARKNAADFETRLLAEYITEDRNVLTYDNLPGLYRLQVRIDGKVKTVARIKAQRDVYILVREEVAQAINADYLLINYNLPAGFHTDYETVFEWLEKICRATEDQTEAPTE